MQSQPQAGRCCTCMLPVCLHSCSPCSYKAPTRIITTIIIWLKHFPLYIVYHISSKSRSMVRGQQHFTYAHTHFTCVQIGLSYYWSCVHAWVLISVDAALELLPHQMGPWDKISPQQDFEEIQYTCIIITVVSRVSAIPLITACGNINSWPWNA